MRLSSSDEAVALVQQEMSNLKALKRLSIGAMMSPLDPDLPGFNALPDSYSPDKRQQPAPVDSGPELPSSDPDTADPAASPGLSRSASGRREGTYTPSRRLNIDSQEAHDLIWVPARLHPEIAPNEWRSFVENRVQEIKNNVEHQSKSSPEPASSSSTSRLSHEIADSADLMDASDVLERRRRSSTPSDTRRLSILELSTQLKSLGELESLAALSGSFSSSDDQPWSPPPEDNLDQPLSPGASLRRSGGSSRRRTRPAIRRKPAQDGENDSPPVTPTSASPPDVPVQSPERQELRNRVTKAVPVVTDTSPRQFTRHPEENIYQDPEALTSEPAHQQPAVQGTLASSPQAEPERVFYGSPSPSKPGRPTGLTIDVGKNPHQPPVESEEKKNKPLWRWLKQDKEKEKDKDHEKDDTPAPQSPTTQMFSKMFKKKKKEAQGSPQSSPPQAPHPSSAAEPSTQVEQKQDWPSTPARPGHSRQRSRTANYANIEGVNDSAEQRMPDTAKSRSATQNTQKHPQKQRGSSWKKQRQRENREQDREDASRPQRSENSESKAVVQAMQLPYEIPAHQLSDRSNIMMYHRFPLHIERAIYRLSHMKLANPRRPLGQQVLLSNFMYAYLNLINQGYQRQMEAAGALPEGENPEGYVPGEEANDEGQSDYEYDGYASYDVSYMESSEMAPDGLYYEQHAEYEAPTDFEFFQGQSSSSSESDASEEMNEMWDEQDHEYQQPLMA